MDKINTPINNSRTLTDFFKGIAIILVILVHSHQIFVLAAPYTAVQRFGQMGCQIFFVLSSFGLCHTFSNGPVQWLPYMKKRISKLAIGYWGAIFLHAIYRVSSAIFSQESILSALHLPGILINLFFLNGLIPIREINNGIVRGGWFVGTTVLLYAIFPLLHKLYFTNKSNIWQKYRPLLFPLAVFLASSAIVILLGSLHPMWICSNNSFMYFSFLNQMTPFVLGLVLFDVCNRFQNARGAFCCPLLFLLLSVFLFFGNWKYAFVFCPSTMAISVALLYWHLIDNQKAFTKISVSSGTVIKLICKLGKLSFSIYLTHSFIVYEFSSFCLSFLRRIYNNDALWYLLLLPIEFCLIVALGYAYDKCLQLSKKRLKKKNNF